jgi:hypothetical protein
MIDVAKENVFNSRKNVWKNITHVFVDKGSHFMLIEYPLKIAGLVNENIKDL